MSTEADATTFPSASNLDDIVFVALRSGAWENVPAYLVQAALQRLAHKTADYSILSSDLGTLFTNLGATGVVTLQLPTAVVGMRFRFAVRVAQWLQVDVYAGENLESTATPPVAAAAGKYIRSNSIGSVLELACLETGKWAVMNSRGTWAVET